MSRSAGGPTRARRTAAGLALLVALPLLAACTGSNPDYCSTLKDEHKTLTGLADRADQRRGDVLTPTLVAFERLRSAAPQQLSDEWDTVVSAYRALSDAVQQAGADPADYRPGKRPPGVSGARARHLAEVAAELDSPRVAEAVAGIEDQAQQVCNVDFRG